MTTSKPGLPPSIFNDVIGPVMRGPSSSHSAASVRIGLLARALCGGTPEHVQVDFDTGGSLATTHESQGSDMGLFGGLLGWEADDARLPGSAAALRAAGAGVEIRLLSLDDPHPNTYRLRLQRGGCTTSMVAISTGGGMIEVVEIDGSSVSLRGDRHVTLWTAADRTDACALAGRVKAHAAGAVEEVEATDNLVVAFSAEELAPDVLQVVADASVVRQLPVVLPVQSRRGLRVPFLHASELGSAEELRGRRLSDYALLYETTRGGISEVEVLGKMRRILGIMRGGVDGGLQGTEYPGRVLPQQSHLFSAALADGRLFEAGLLNRAILYVTALMETKSSMGVIVAAPTAGSCATFPGTCLAAVDAIEADEDRTLRAMLAAGLVGVFVATRSSFAAEVGGCQAETGAGAAMAAAALVELCGGAADRALSAASHALQNVLGLICDPVANRVEAPCLGRNVAGAANAIACANMAVAGYDHLIPLDEVLDAHREVSERMARELRCTALGGLSVTPTSKAIEARLCGDGGCGSCS
jgi:L-serine dehydratase